MKLAGILGTGAMCVAPFIIATPQGKLLAIVGLAFLTVQALDLKAYNLIFLNAVGIAGYTFSMLGV